MTLTTMISMNMIIDCLDHFQNGWQQRGLFPFRAGCVRAIMPVIVGGGPEALNPLKSGHECPLLWRQLRDLFPESFP
jgi:hypothetical protein